MAHVEECSCSCLSLFAIRLVSWPSFSWPFFYMVIVVYLISFFFPNDAMVVSTKWLRTFTTSIGFVNTAATCAANIPVVKDANGPYQLYLFTASRPHAPSTAMVCNFTFLRAIGATLTKKEVSTLSTPIGTVHTVVELLRPKAIQAVEASWRIGSQNQAG